MTGAIIQSLAFQRFKPTGFSQQKYITPVNLALLVSFKPHIQLCSLDKCQVLHTLISPMDNQVSKVSREAN